MKTLKALLLAIAIIASYSINAQVAVTTDGSSAHGSAMLEVTSTNKGMLIPRVALTGTSDVTTITTAATSLMVYNTATTSDVTPGFYYWTGTAWVRFLLSGGTTGWATTGNAGTVDGTNFLGTTDDIPLNFRVNNEEAGRIGISTDGSTFLGYQAGLNDDLSNNLNTFIGYQAGNANTTGFSNTANGYQALSANTTGAYNTANGYQALRSNTTGNYNTANGGNALLANTTGYSNTANGRSALLANTTGNSNTANGYDALSSNTTGNSNTANGCQSLDYNTTGYNNTANGFNALYSNTTGNTNTANGVTALRANTTGYWNTANGVDALRANTTGNYNTANGVSALMSNTVGAYNTATGLQALYSNTTGNYNTACGSNAYFSNSFDNATGIGYNAQPGASNTVRIGNDAVTSIGGHAAWTNTSDGRFKTNVKENVAGIDFIMKLRPVTYNFDMNAIAKFNKTPDSLRLPESEKLKGAEIQSGFIAQEVESAALSVGYDFHGVDKPKNETSHYGLRYAEFVVPMVKAMQEQQVVIEAQQQKIEELQKENQDFEQRLLKLEQKK